jgi:enamine deaminase RidA (YjgF/YER057c/UK114 family)
MTVELRNVPGWPEPAGFSHVSIAPVGRVVHLAGTGGTRPDGTLEDGLAAQTERAVLNLFAELDAAGAEPEDLVRLTFLVVGWTGASIPELVAGVTAAGRSRPLPPVPSTLHGVQSLFFDGMLVEIDGVAIIGASS